jgi:hypothetical protein
VYVLNTLILRVHSQISLSQVQISVPQVQISVPWVQINVPQVQISPQNVMPPSDAACKCESAQHPILKILKMLTTLKK